MTDEPAKLSIQLYSARHIASPEAQLEIVARCGYAHVETFGPWHDDPEASARLLAAHGLSALSAHIPFEIITQTPERAAAICKALGARYAVAPYLDGAAHPKDAAGWRRIGEALARAAETLAPQGLTVVWHNHGFEFRPLPDGSEPIVALLGEAGLWEADLAWAARAGADPAPWLERYRGRIPLIHVKDIAPKGENQDEGGWADVGAGVLPWAELWRQARAAGAGVFVAEHDEPADFERFARVSAQAMRGFAKGAP